MTLDVTTKTLGTGRQVRETKKMRKLGKRGTTGGGYDRQNVRKSQKMEITHTSCGTNPNKICDSEVMIPCRGEALMSSTAVMRSRVRSH